MFNPYYYSAAESNLNFLRAMWMLEHQIHDVDDLVHYWQLLGKPFSK